MKKRVTSIILAMMMLLTSSANVYAGNENELWAEAEEIEVFSDYSYTLGTEMSGAITETVSENTYEFTLPSSGSVVFDLVGNIEYISGRLYDSQKKEIWSFNNHEWDGNTKQNSIKTTLDLTKGVYYLQIVKSSAWGSTGNYSFSLDFTTAKESFEEVNGADNNNMLDIASQVSLNENYKGQIAINDDMDFYVFTLPSSGSVVFDLVGNIAYISSHLYDSQKKEIWSLNDHEWDGNTKQNNVKTTLDLTRGTYYLQIGKTWRESTGNYNFSLNFTSARESFEEVNGADNNNMLDIASQVSLNENYKGQIAINDDMDFYVFTLPSSGGVVFDLVGNIAYISSHLYDSQKKEIWSLDDHEWDGNTKQNNVKTTLNLTKGVYYLQIVKSSRWKSTGNYDFSLNFTSARESFEEVSGENNNNLLGVASNISLNTKYTGQIAINDDVDFYQFVIPLSEKVFLNFTGRIERIDFNLYDGAGNEVWRKENSWNGSTQLNIFNGELTLTPGKYYLRVAKYYNRCGVYQFSIGRKEILNDPEVLFQDVRSGDWYKQAVDYVYEKELMTGLNSSFFGPAQRLARAQFAVILHRMNGEVQMEYSRKFPDVSRGLWYTDAILWANSIGVVNGYSNGRFGPGDNITREQMAVMMYRYAQYKNYDVSEKADFSNFRDAYRVSGFAQEAMEWAVGTSIITGKDSGRSLDPQGSANRAECAAIIMRFVEKYE